MSWNYLACYEVHLDAKPALINLELGPAFKPSDDFAPISTGPLMISRVMHDLLIEVNEGGTEMAAVTVVAMREASIFPF
jgi:serpin B